MSVDESPLVVLDDVTKLGVLLRADAAELDVVDRSREVAEADEVKGS